MGNNALSVYKSIKVKQNIHMFQSKGRFRPTDPPMPNVNIKKLVPRFDSLIILTCTSFKNGAQYMIEPPSPSKNIDIVCL